MKTISRIVKGIFKLIIKSTLIVFLVITLTVMGLGTYYYSTNSFSPITHTTSVSIETVRERILEELKGPLSEYKKENTEAVNRFAENLYGDLVSLKANVPEFVDEVTSIGMMFKFAKAKIEGWISDGNPSDKLAEDVVKEHLIKPEEITAIFHKNLESLENDLAYNRNRLYAEVNDVVYREISTLPLSEAEIEAMINSVTEIITMNGKSVANNAVFSSTLKEVGSLAMGEVLGSVINSSISRVATTAVEETAVGASVLATSEGASSITGVIGIGIGSIVYLAVDYVMSGITEEHLTEKTEEMIDSMAKEMVYGEGSGLYSQVLTRVYEFTERDMAYINSGISRIGE